jgi:hypothetical protein
MTRARVAEFMLITIVASWTSFAWGETVPESAKLIVPRRVSSKVVDLGRVYPIYLVAGMATVIEIPGPVTGIRTGNPDSILYFRPDKPENEVTVVLRNQNAKPTNLIIRSGGKKYIFDLVPSKQLHQDTIEVVGDYGGPGFEGSDAELLDSSDLPAKEVAKKGGAK